MAIFKSSNLNMLPKFLNCMVCIANMDTNIPLPDPALAADGKTIDES